MSRKHKKENKQAEDQQQSAEQDSENQQSDEEQVVNEKLAELEKERNDLLEKLQRVSADFINFQNRAPKQIADSVAYEKKSIIKSLLPSLDNFQHALAGAKNAEKLEDVIKGIEMIFQHLLDALKLHGVKEIEAVGEEFNPAFHEAVMQRSEPDKPDNTVLEEYQTGYKINEQVLRPSKVIVNKVKAERNEPNEEPDAGDEEQE